MVSIDNNLYNISDITVNIKRYVSIYIFMCSFIQIENLKIFILYYMS